MTNIRDNWRRVQEQVAAAAAKAGRNPDSIQIVAVTKTFPVEIIRSAADAGIGTIGENRVQEAWQKFQACGDIVSWHLVGHLQTNKVKRALQIFDVIHSVDSPHLAQALSQRCSQNDQDIDVFLEIKTSDEPTKLGVSPDGAAELAHELVALPRVHLKGLMTVGKWSSEESEVRACFQKLARLRDDINATLTGTDRLSELSMGMSGDFAWAIEEGATVVRIGTAIFGRRSG